MFVEKMVQRAEVKVKKDFQPDLKLKVNILKNSKTLTRISYNLFFLKHSFEKDNTPHIVRGHVS